MPMYAASRNRDHPTRRCAFRSRAATASRSSIRRSARSRQIKIEPEAVSTKLSIPKPRRATLFAPSAAKTAMMPSQISSPPSGTQDEGRVTALRLSLLVSSRKLRKSFGGPYRFVQYQACHCRRLGGVRDEVLEIIDAMVLSEYSSFGTRWR